MSRHTNQGPNNRKRLKNNNNKDSSNSSKPSSTNGYKKVITNNREKSGKKQGGQVGHKGETLTKEKIDKMIENKEIDRIIIVEENKNRKLSKKAVHITVEVGIIKEEMPELQVAIISPNIQGAHTVNERVEIASIERTTKWIEKFIKLYNRIA